MSQTTVLDNLAVAVEGLVAEAVPNSMITRIAKEAIPFGRFVSFGAGDGDKGASLPDTSGEVTGAGLLLGVAIFETSRETKTPPDIQNLEPFTILRRGTIWCFAENAVTEGNAVFVRFTNGAGGTEHGRVRSDADTATAAQAPAGVVFRSTTTGAGLVKVEINLP